MTVSLSPTAQSIIQAYPSLDSLKQDKAEWIKLKTLDRVMLMRAFSERDKYVSEDQQESATQIIEIKSDAEDKEADEKSQKESKPHETFSLSVQYNDRQNRAIELASLGKSFCLTGKAGTGKTTTLRAVMKALLECGFTISEIGAGAFTRVASANIRRAVEKDPELAAQMMAQIKTIHAHLEFKPFFWDDLNTGKKRMEFRPARNESNPLDLKLMVIEEASMLDLILWDKWYRAMKPNTIMIFVGDLNQLPPVFGKSIFNYALNQLPIVELNEVYRQAGDSGILTNAYRVLDGLIPESNKDCQVVIGNAQVKTGQKKLGLSLGKTGGFFHKLYKNKEYIPSRHIILSPWNKRECGTKALNNWIAQFLGDERKAIVHEVIAGMNKCYLAIGDQVFVDKRLGHIEAITVNGDYQGKQPKPASVDLLRIGEYRVGGGASLEDFESSGYEDINVDEVVEAEEKKMQASHVIYIRWDDADQEVEGADAVELYEMRTAGEFADAKFSLGYSLTCHKAQGCEWEKVFIVMHEDHYKIGSFISREWLYTAITRAREKLVIIAKKDVLDRAVSNQIIKGKTIDEKIAYINSGANNIGDFPVIKER